MSNIITRKIQVSVFEDDKNLKNEYYSLLREWSFICRKAANMISNHLFLMDHSKDVLYFTDNVKAKLTNFEKDKDGILNTSYQNSTYRLLSKSFKGKIPTVILSALNQQISKVYKEEKDEYFNGSRSLRSYKSNIPIPITTQGIKINNEANSNKNYYLTIHNIPLVTYFGKDRSNNKLIIKRILDEEYKLKGSSIQYLKNKWFLLLTVEIPDKIYKPVKGVQVECNLDVENPIIAKCGKTIEKIGNKEEYLHQRTQIQYKLSNLQKSLKYAKGGNGRKKKLKAIDRFRKKESNYIKTKLHTYSRMLIDFAVKHNADTILLQDQKEKELNAKDNEFILRNWNYYNLIGLIEYKAKFYGIKIIKQ